MKPISRILGFALLVVTTLHCSAASSRTVTTAAPAPAGRLGPKVPPAPECLSNACTKEGDCANGFRCNTALAEPTCQAIRCGDIATLCSSADVCANGMQCHKEQCNPCNFCGDLCEVDFSSDREHCGSCGVRAPETFLCVAGAAVCPEGKTDCDGRCVDLNVDRNNCGECGRTIEPSEACVAGVVKSTCQKSERACSGQPCRTPFDTANCGNVCGTARTCASGFECVAQNYQSAGEKFACQQTVRSTDVSKSCNAVCSAEGLVCADGGWVEASDLRAGQTHNAFYRSGGTLYGTIIACGSVPPATSSGRPFDSLVCRCSAR
jgi:Stigma-specific protein, Stig1